MSDSSSNDVETRTAVASLAVAIIALAISLIALLGTLGQLFQQYLATAVGYSNCGERVMGPWAKHTKLRFRPWELRFEVIFEAPVFFVCPPTNLRGPVRNAPVYYIDGSKYAQEALDYYQHTPDSRTKELQAQYNGAASASWLLLISLVSRMEDESRTWNMHQLLETGPGMDQGAYGFLSLATCSVAMQRRSYTLDLMPDGVKKPFAVTTMCHVIEIAALLGAHWKQFSRRDDRYVAEGNGIIITGTNIPHLGLMFTFATHNPSKFKASRLIPSDDIKSYCFGLVPTIFAADDEARWRRLSDYPNSLKFGTRSDIVHTISRLGCNQESVDCFAVESRRNTAHLFPVVYEIIGMAASVVRIKGLCFRVLPNPTPCQWDSSQLSFDQLMKSFSENLATSDDLNSRDLEVQLITDISNRLLEISTSANVPVQAQSPEQQPEATIILSPELMDELQYAIEWSTTVLKSEFPRDILLDVLRAHIDAMLDLLNQDQDPQDPYRYLSGVSSILPTGPYHRKTRNMPTGWRENELAKFYTNDILHRVVSRLDRARQRRARTFEPPEVAEPWQREQNPDGTEPRRFLPEEATSSAATAWALLMFRMICWLWLHDFHPDDTQIPKGDFYGSRLPVYIG